MCGALVYNKHLLINMHGMNIKIRVYCICKNNNLSRCARGIPTFAGPYVWYSLSYVLSPWSFAYSCYIVATLLGHSKQTENRNATDRPKKFCQTELNTWKWTDMSKLGNWKAEPVQFAEVWEETQYPDKWRSLSSESNTTKWSSSFLSTRPLPICFALW
jgi:hypothetical protein